MVISQCSALLGLGAYGPSDVACAFLASIDVPGALVTAPFGINARGEVVGYYTDAGGVWRGFVTTSVRHLSP